MKEFSPREVRDVAEKFERDKMPVERLVMEGNEYWYYVLPKELAPDLSEFAFRMTSKDSNGKPFGVFGVSSSVCKELRPFWVAHEVFEFIQIGIHEKGRCKASEIKTLEIIPPHLREFFIGRRAFFFNNLANYITRDIEAGNGNFTVDDLREVQATLQFLSS